MDIKSIKQSFAVTTAQPHDDDDVQYLSKANQFFLLSKFINRLVEDDEFSEI